MRKMIVFISVFLLLLTGCVAKNNAATNSGVGSNTNSPSKNPKMTAVVKQISYTDDKLTSILVFDDTNSAFVFAVTEKVDFKDLQTVKTGDKLEIEHSGEIRESYPAQGTALKISILDNKTSENVDENLYSVLPIRGDYVDYIFEKSMNSFGTFADIIDSKEKFDKYMSDVNFDSENKINLSSKYDEEFFKTNKLVFVAKSTSSTPKYNLSGLTKSQNKLNIIIEETTSEIQTTDILLKGFLIEADNSLITSDTAINVEYLYRVSTK